MTDLDDFLIPGGALTGKLFARVLARVPEPTQTTLGDRIGPFRVLRELGRGGMGAVYQAERADDTVAQTVALKVMHPAVATSEAQALFARERQWLVDLDHPNIARFIDAGTLDDGRPWLALEWVDGQTLRERLQEKTLTVPQVIDWMKALCAAVGLAHRNLLVHRDLKPGNVMIRADGTVKLLDFGIAALTSELDPSLAMSVPWASPEQRRHERVGPSSDLWQLGSILLACLDAVQASRVPKGLRAIGNKATREQPQHRYASCAEFAADLDALATHHPLLADPPGLARRIGLFARRHPGASLASSALIISVVALTVLFTHRLGLERDAARLEANRANAATKFMTELFLVADPGNARGNTLTANQILARGAERLDTELVDQPEVRAQLLSTVALVHMGLGQLDDAEALAQKAIVTARGSTLPLDVVAGIERGLAQVLWRRGDFAGALATARAASSRLNDRSDPKLRVQLRHTETVALLMLSRLDEALVAQQAALVLARDRLPDNDPLLGQGLNNLARIQNELGQHDAAIITITEARDLVVQRSGADHPDSLDIGLTLARQLGRGGRVAEGRDIVSAIEPVLKKVVGESQYRYGYLLLVRAELTRQSGRSADALPDAERALQVYESSTGMDNPLLIPVLESLVGIERDLGLIDEARTHLARLLELRQRLFPAGHADIDRTRRELETIDCIDPIADGSACHQARNSTR